MHFYWFRHGIPRAGSIVFVKIMWKWDTFSIYTYQSTDAVRKRHLCIHISPLMQSENGISLLFYIFLSHENEKKKWKKGECCVLSTSTCAQTVNLLLTFDDSKVIFHLSIYRKDDEMSYCIFGYCGKMKKCHLSPFATGQEVKKYRLTTFVLVERKC
jgi:hypothetical protein